MTVLAIVTAMSPIKLLAQTQTYRAADVKIVDVFCFLPSGLLGAASLVIAILFGMAIRSVWNRCERWPSGVAFTAKQVLDVAGEYLQSGQP
jgi:hypothetical protein